MNPCRRPTSRPVPAQRGTLDWRVYAIDGALLGAFMVSACGFVALLEHRHRLFIRPINFGLARRALIGIAMGLTALSRSTAHGAGDPVRI